MTGDMDNPFTLRQMRSLTYRHSRLRFPLLALSDQDLVKRAREGDLQAFDELVSIHQARVYALARRILASDDDAADVQQETFVRAWRSLKGFRGDAGFATWLHRITVNLCLSRKRKHEAVLDESYFTDSLLHSAEPSAATALERAELVADVRKVLAGHARALPGVDRAAGDGGAAVRGDREDTRLLRGKRPNPRLPRQERAERENETVSGQLDRPPYEGGLREGDANLTPAPPS